MSNEQAYRDPVTNEIHQRKMRPLRVKHLKEAFKSANDNLKIYVKVRKLDCEGAEFFDYVEIYTVSLDEEGDCILGDYHTLYCSVKEELRRE